MLKSENKPRNGSTESTDRVYGYELVLDLKNCDTSRFNRESIDKFFTSICRLIHMEKCVVHFWDDIGVPLEDQQVEPHTKGTSAVCFILTSSIVVHTLDLLATTYVNIFSCKSFSPSQAIEFTAQWFGGDIANSHFLQRH